MSFYLGNIFCKLTIPTPGNISTSYLQKIVFIKLYKSLFKNKIKENVVRFLFPLFICAIFVKVYHKNYYQVFKPDIVNCFRLFDDQ